MRCPNERLLSRGLWRCLDTIAPFYWIRLNAVTDPKTWMCLICGWIYDESVGDPEHGIPAGTRWADVPDDWLCPECAVGKADFEMVEI